jgi:hypothetical protein
LAKQGNEWIWTRDAKGYAPQRRAIAAYEKQSAEMLASATAALAEARKVKAQLLTQGKSQHDAGVLLVLDAGDTTVKTWQQKLAQSNRIVLYVVLAAMLFSIIFLIKMSSDGEVPEFKDLTEVLGDSYEITLNAIIAGLSALNRQAEKVGQFGVVPPSVPPDNLVPPAPRTVPPIPADCPPSGCPPTKRESVPPAEKRTVPPDAGGQNRTKYPPHVRRQIDKLRDNIKKYNRRAKEGTISEHGRGTLAAWQKQLDEIKAAYNARS